MNFFPTNIAGLFIVQPHVFIDDRGLFIKIFSQETFEQYGLSSSLGEVFYSKSKKNVLRGFHIQLPPADAEKLVWVTDGTILDVTLDLRKTSATYGICYGITLSEENFKALYIPRGIAHSFYVLSDTATVAYQVGKVFSAAADSGILWNSVDYKWPCTSPIISARDGSLCALQSYDSPF